MYTCVQYNLMKATIKFQTRDNKICQKKTPVHVDICIFNNICTQCNIVIKLITTHVRFKQGVTAISTTDNKFHNCKSTNFGESYSVHLQIAIRLATEYFCDRIWNWWCVTWIFVRCNSVGAILKTLMEFYLVLQFRTISNGLRVL